LGDQSSSDESEDHQNDSILTPKSEKRKKILITNYDKKRLQEVRIINIYKYIIFKLVNVKFKQFFYSLISN